MKRKKLGEVLRERGHVSSADLTKAIEEQSGKVIHLGELMLERGLVGKNDLGAALTEVTHIPYVNCDLVEVDPDVLKIVSYQTAKRLSVLPIHSQGKNLVVVMAEPQNLTVIDELKFSTGMNVVTQFAFRKEIDAAVERAYGTAQQAEAVLAAAISPKTEDPGMEFISSSSQQRNIEAMQEMQAELLQKTTPAVRLVASTITAASAKQASDIHIEPQAADTVIRLRIDGMLRDYEHIPRTIQNSVVSRIKILADMDIAERRAPQDGRFLVKISGRKLDLRVSTLPTQYGEKVVMRLLESSAPLQDFSALGIPSEISTQLSRILAQPQGMLLVTGPTGSGKSTTLYSSLHKVRRPSVNIVTVEDPVEYELPGLNQVQVNTKAGLTFATCLRSILRQDPNVIMIGEIRDKETAEIAIKAAQTGHMVLSTLHTNDSISGVTRLLDLGVAGFQIATSVTGILAQRLVRRLCSCHEVIPASPEYIASLLQAGMTDPPTDYHFPRGCDACDNTGYKGRIGIYEILVLDDAIRTAVRNGGRNDEIRDLARHNGMKMMQEYVLEAVRDGITTLEEAQRVVPFETIGALLCDACHRDLSPIFLFCPYCGVKRRGKDKNGSKRATKVLAEQGAKSR